MQEGLPWPCAVAAVDFHRVEDHHGVPHHSDSRSYASVEGVRRWRGGVHGWLGEEAGWWRCGWPWSALVGMPGEGRKGKDWRNGDADADTAAVGRVGEGGGCRSVWGPPTAMKRAALPRREWEEGRWDYGEASRWERKAMAWGLKGGRREAMGGVTRCPAAMAVAGWPWSVAAMPRATGHAHYSPQGTFGSDGGDEEGEGGRGGGPLLPLCRPPPYGHR